jgi:hypothetical protein
MSSRQIPIANALNDDNIVYLLPQNRQNMNTKKLRMKIWRKWGRPKLVKENNETIRAIDGRSANFYPLHGVDSLRGLENSRVIQLS